MRPRPRFPLRAHRHRVLHLRKAPAHGPPHLQIRHSFTVLMDDLATPNRNRMHVTDHYDRIIRGPASAVDEMSAKKGTYANLLAAVPTCQYGLHPFGEHPTMSSVHHGKIASEFHS